MVVKIIWRITELKFLKSVMTLKIIIKNGSAKTYLRISEVGRGVEVFDTVVAHFEPISEAIHITCFRHTAALSDICTANSKT